MKIYVTRFKPDTDLKQEIIKFAQSENIKAGLVLTCVGSLRQACLRFANQAGGTHFNECFEVISLVGTITATEGVHLHIGIANDKGQVLGGHLVDGNLIYTTVELAIAESSSLIFHRRIDARYGYRELIVDKVD